MALKHTELGQDLTNRCIQWGIDLARHYAAGGSPNSLAVSWGGIESDPLGLAVGKMAECVFCLEQGMDPLRDLHWEKWADDGCDLVKFYTRFDVKGTLIKSRYLVWPLGKNGRIYLNKKFDVLVHTKVDLAGFGSTYGFISKKRFYKIKEIVGPGHRLPGIGTWCVHESKLTPISEFGRCFDPALKHQLEELEDDWLDDKPSWPSCPPELERLDQESASFQDGCAALAKRPATEIL